MEWRQKLRCAEKNNPLPPLKFPIEVFGLPKTKKAIIFKIKEMIVVAIKKEKVTIISDSFTPI